MGFAGAYLLKAGTRGQLVDAVPDPRLKIIVTIPVHNESGLERCLDSLFLSAPPGSPGRKDPGSMSPREASPLGSSPLGSNPLGSNPLGSNPLGSSPLGSSPFHAEVLILVNAAAEAPSGVLDRNRETLREARAWIEAHPHPSITFHAWLDHSFSAREAGVGMARKVLMDEAARRFDMAGNPGGIIASLDADTVVDPNYLDAIVGHFEDRGPVGAGQDGARPDGCSIYFEHPLEPEDLQAGSGDRGSRVEAFPAGVYEAIARYELHLRYYVQAVRFTGYPYAFHTVGSAFAVRADIYCKEGGMSRRQGGEDFYFIQKVAARGNWGTCNTTRVVPSPRPSGRVPFGTGPAVERYLETGEPLMTYHPGAFRMLKVFFSDMAMLGSDRDPGSITREQPGVLARFLDEQEFGTALLEIRANSASPATFRKRFWRWFNMFRIMKFLHYAREYGYPDMEVGKAANILLQHLMDDAETLGSRQKTSMNDLLLLFRHADKITGKILE